MKEQNAHRHFRFQFQKLGRILLVDRFARYAGVVSDGVAFRETVNDFCGEKLTSQIFSRLSVLAHWLNPQLVLCDPLFFAIETTRLSHLAASVILVWR